MEAVMPLRLVSVLCMFAGVLIPAVTRGQPATEFSQLPLKLNLGDVVTVTDTSNRRVRGPVREMTADRLVVERDRQPQRFGVADVREVVLEGVPDSRTNGALIGFGVMALPALLADLPGPAERAFYGIGNGLIGALIGAFIDGYVKGRETVYRAAPPTVTLSIGPAATRGAQLGVRLRW
jgi:hypothetical protein